MTVADLRSRMSNQEWVEWTVYYGRKAQRREMEQRKANGGSRYPN